MQKYDLKSSPVLSPLISQGSGARPIRRLLDYSEFAEYDVLQKEFKDAAHGDEKDLELKTMFFGFGD